MIDSGPLDGPLVVLLHGFPETAHSWEQTSELLHQHGFRTLAIHQRGYSLNARPQSRFHYALSELTEDVAVRVAGFNLNYFEFCYSSKQFITILFKAAIILP